MLLRTYTKEEVNNLVETEVNKVKTELTQVILKLENRLQYLEKIKSWDNLKLNSTYWNEKALNDAILEGNLEKIKWLKINGCPFYNNNINSTNYMITALSNGDINILQYLKDNGFSLDSNIFSKAVLIGNIEILNWLKDNNYYFDHRSFYSAIENNNLNIIKWLYKNKCIYAKSIANKYKDYLKDQPEIIKWLEVNGFIFV